MLVIGKNECKINIQSCCNSIKKTFIEIMQMIQIFYNKHGDVKLRQAYKMLPQANHTNRKRKV